MLNLRIVNKMLLVSNLSLTEGQIKARLIADYASGVSAVTVDNISGWVIAKGVIIGQFGQATSELIKTHGATAPTGSTITFASATAFDHYTDTELTMLDYDQVEFSRAATLTGVKSVLGSVQNINPDEKESYYKDLTNTTGYAFARFKNSTSGVFSEYSQGVPYSGNTAQSAQKIVEKACNNTGVEVGGQYSSEQMLLDDINDCQGSITDNDWSFELVEDTTSLVASTGENRYNLSALTNEIKYSGTGQGIKALLFRNKPLDFIDTDEMDALYADVKNTTIATTAAIGATSIVLTDTAEFSDSGTCYAGGFTIVYTANDKTTNTLSGISATIITAQIDAGSSVWQAISPGLPSRYTIFDGQIILDSPVLSDYDGFKFKIKYLKKLPDFTDFISTTTVPFPDIMWKYVASRIETRKRNFDEAKIFMDDYLADLKDKESRFMLPTMEEFKYHNFFDDIDSHDSDNRYYNTL